ncbi:anthranilate synthase component I family protein [Aureispira anguillae]|uniref:Anthranilate synthase component I family protein n=1 Tax=Aureispira anguillae TaxID=2864201 RepID=A0A915YLF3_9BACT|nr:anthranilate synthase component I family protein [Aureispira anguillae]BDS15169.1 anthranilate synthase component I family protein [Aureispira anguillae]
MKISISSNELIVVKQKILFWADAHSDVVCYLDSNQYDKDPYSQYDSLIAVGAEHALCVETAGTAFDQLKSFAKKHKKWLFGHLSYDLKNEVEELRSENKDVLDFPELYFFIPSYLFLFHKNGTLEIKSERETTALLWEQIQGVVCSSKVAVPPINLKQVISKEQYLEIIEQVQQHIVDGDIYEMNFCQEFFSRAVELDPLSLFEKMNRIAKAPYSVYYKRGAQYLLCGSPERFLCKRANKLISQPIKGTIQRGASPEEDLRNKNSLKNSIKDQAENVMIVDLVRNDLARVCQTGSIQVEELFKIYGFEKVFQMISTVTGQLQEDKNWVDALAVTFPMGSMTGAPKVMSMKLIEQYEQTKRGLYAGAVGYVTPDEDFDFNVVIRSLLYNRTQKYLSFQVGGAIVYDSEPLAEYEECLLKAKTMLEALGTAKKY